VPAPATSSACARYWFLANKKFS